MITRLTLCRALHNTCALVSFLYIVFSFLIDCGRVKRKHSISKRHRRSHAFKFLVGFLILSYITEGIASAAQGDGFIRSQARITHTVSLALAWFVEVVRKRSIDRLLGISLITAVFEIPILALSSVSGLGRFGPTSQLVIQSTRVLVLLYFIIRGCHARLRGRQVSRDESRPFLHSNGSSRSSDTTYGAASIRSQSDLEDDNSVASDDNDDDSDSGSDDDGDIKKLRAKRLKETGSWWIYFKDFSILLPFLIPRKDRKVQLCLFINLLCLLAKRALRILIPRQLGIVTDKILAKEGPYEALGIWLLLNMLSNESGIGLIEELAKIPVKQFSYRQITNAAFAHVMSLSMDFHAERDSAEVMKAISQGESLTTLLETAVIEIAPTIVDLVVAFIFLYWKFNIYASLGMLAASLAYVSGEVFTANWNMPNRRRVTKAEREEARVMHQAVQGWQTVSYFNRFASEKARFSERIETNLKASRDYDKRRAYCNAVTETLIPITFFGLSCLVIYDVSRGRASAGDFVFFIQYWDTLLWPLQMLSVQYRWLMQDLVDAERLLNLFQTKPTIVDKEGAKDLDMVKGHVAFKNVYFSYDPRRTIIEDVNITAMPGETIALVGMTGAGKSSIMKLLLRLYDVSSGQVEIDGHDIRDITLSSLREALGVVPQDPLLFNTTIMENLRYARPSVTDDEVFDACRAAAIHDKILTFADGYNTKVGEQGVKLSGGELQRLAIARVFLKDPPILILDEATSAVDTTTESLIQVALDRVRSRRTVFMIAHRLSTVVAADKILVMHLGRIVESGTHQELLRMEGRYRDLWARQIQESKEMPTADEEVSQQVGDDPTT